MAVIAVCPELLNEPTNSTHDDVVTQIEDKRFPAEVRLRDPYYVGQAQGRLLQDVGDADPPLLPSPQASLHVRARVWVDDDTDLPNANRRHCLQGVVDHWLVRHGDQVLVVRVRQRPQARPTTPCSYQRLHALTRNQSSERHVPQDSQGS